MFVTNSTAVMDRTDISPKIHVQLSLVRTQKTMGNSNKATNPKR